LGTRSYVVRGVTVVVLLGALVAASHVAASPSNHNLGTYVGQARVSQHRYGRIVDSCRIVVHLAMSAEPFGSRLEVQRCQKDEPFLGCAFPLGYFDRGGAVAETWLWLISGRGRSLKGQVCKAPRSVPRQFVRTTLTTPDGERITLTIRGAFGGPAIVAALRRT
jgi:hypothetical protein